MNRLTALVALLMISSVIAQEDPNYTPEGDWAKKENWPKIVAADYPKVTDADDALTKLLKERLIASQVDLQREYSFWLDGSGAVRLVADGRNKRWRRASTLRVQEQTELRHSRNW